MNQPDEPGSGVRLRPNDMFELARALRVEATNFRGRTRRIARHFGGEAARPWAADRRNEPGDLIVTRHDESMAAGLATLRDYATAMERLATMAERITDAYRDQDDLNGADLDEVAGLLGLTETEL